MFTYHVCDVVPESKTAIITILPNFEYIPDIFNIYFFRK